MAVTEVKVQGENGAVSWLTVPESGHRRDLFDQMVASGRVVVLDGAPPAAPDSEPDSEPGAATSVELPGKGARKADWVDAAVASGMDPGTADGMTVAELRVALGADES